MKFKKNKVEKLEIIIEKNDGLLWGRVENKGKFMPTPYGTSTAKVILNLKELINDYIKHEGKKDPFWNKVDLNYVAFEFKYDLESYFQEHDYLKISSIAEIAGMNPSLIRQYASGVKYPSAEQAEKLQKAIRKIARDLMRDGIYVT
jgi:hypothetical protein